MTTNLLCLFVGGTTAGLWFKHPLQFAGYLSELAERVAGLLPVRVPESVALALIAIIGLKELVRLGRWLAQCAHRWRK